MDDLIQKIITEIDEQLNSANYLEKHPETAKATIISETEEYLRGFKTALRYIKEFIITNKKGE